MFIIQLVAVCYKFHNLDVIVKVHAYKVASLTHAGYVTIGPPPCLPQAPRDNIDRCSSVMWEWGTQKTADTKCKMQGPLTPTPAQHLDKG